MTEITTLDSLREHLQRAIELEHATIPPYLCALYSIVPGTNAESTDVIRTIVVEEMIHLTLAANVLNAVGGSPVVDSPDFLAPYPAALPNSDHEFVVPLSRFAPSTIATFMRIEKPEASGAPPEADRFETIGQFYEAVEIALRALCDELGEGAVFTGDPARQVRPEMLRYDGDGPIVVVSDLASALRALNEIEEQGEGLHHDEVWSGERDIFHPERDEVAHYFRLCEIVHGRLYQRGDTPQSGPSGERFSVDWDAVYPMRDNPSTSDYPEGSPERELMLAFNRLYTNVLGQLHGAFNGAPATIGPVVGAMMDLRKAARELMMTPNGDGVTTVGPSFEYARG
ncbi:MAG: ferritin-like domain-containing protein [Acidimicrobiales bacterium]